MTKTFKYRGETFTWVDSSGKPGELDDCAVESGDVKSYGCPDRIENFVLATSPDWEKPEPPAAVNFDEVLNRLSERGLGVTYLNLSSNSGACGTTFVEIRARTTRQCVWSGGRA